MRSTVAFDIERLQRNVNATPFGLTSLIVQNRVAAIAWLFEDNGSIEFAMRNYL